MYWCAWQLLRFTCYKKYIIFIFFHNEHSFSYHGTVLEPFYLKQNMLFMKKYLVKCISGLILGSALLVASCSKDDDPELSRKEMLVGTWSMVQIAHDNNGNGIADASEIQTNPPGSTDINMETFNANGTGNVRLKNATSDTTIAITWAITGGDAYLEVTVPGAPTVNYKILKLTTADLELENSANPDGKDWIWLKKQ